MRDWVGTVLGFIEHLNDGIVVGLTVGICDRMFVGENVFPGAKGVLVGFGVGMLVGNSLGNAVGSVGAGLGTLVGPNVGFVVGPVGASVGN